MKLGQWHTKIDREHWRVTQSVYLLPCWKFQYWFFMKIRLKSIKYEERWQEFPTNYKNERKYFYLCAWDMRFKVEEKRKIRNKVWIMDREWMKTWDQWLRDLSPKVCVLVPGLHPHRLYRCKPLFQIYNVHLQLFWYQTNIHENNSCAITMIIQWLK